ncbi:SRPBCC family protein [Nocardia acidivorans]|uniref:SRPBCC family protein n=1 Tax=Nocardia acidivorans TaxID=404580 RepID=UPI001FE08F0B|nr:SRPBCC family protein [Nocardia acidivorans]
MTTEIAASAETVWQVLTDVESWPQWTASMTRVERLDSGPLAIGSRARIHQPRLLPVVWTVTALDPATGFTWAAGGPGLTTTASHDLTRHDEHTSVRLAIDQTGLAAPILGGLMAGLTRRYLVMESQGLKSRAEQTDGEN